MVDERFSSSRFEQAGFGTDEARSLCKELQTAIHAELDRSIQSAIQEVVNKLNAMGHNLELVEPVAAGECVFREPMATGQGHKFLVGLDTVISVGYPKTYDAVP